MLSCGAAFAQSVTQIRRLADEYYVTNRYQEAAEFYQYLHEAKPTDQPVHLRYAMSLYHSLAYKASERELAKLLNSGFIKDEVLYYYGFLLKLEGRYESADSIFNLLLTHPDTSPTFQKLGRFQQQGCQLGMRFSEGKNSYNLVPIDGVNSPDHDFGLIAGGGGLAVSSTRKSAPKQYYDSQYGGLLPNMIAYRYDESGRLWATNELKSLNSQWGEATGCFDEDGSLLYFSSCRPDVGCKIYVSRRQTSGSWSEPQPLNKLINKPGFDSKQPNLSAGGDTLYFVSNRPGGQGGLDIWMSFKLRENEWGPAVNLGAAINTDGDEMSPFYHSQFGALLFSSNSHVGYGGFDIYMAKGGSLFSAQIYNIGPPFNSPSDDNYFVLNEERGYLSSNRRDNQFDVFSFDYYNAIAVLNDFMAERALVEVAVQGLVSLDLYSFRLEEFEDYYVFHPEANVQARQLEENSIMKQSAQFQVLKGRGRPQSIIRMNLNDSLEMLTVVADEQNFELRLLPDTLTAPTVTQDGEPVDYQLEEMRFDGYRYEFERIYFDFDSEQLREESKETLADLVATFRTDNIVMVDLYTHTDHFGNYEYNYELSERRGLNILDHLHGLGVDYDQLRVFPNGEKELLSSEDSWYSRLFNRRAEIIIYTKEPVVFLKPEVFILRKDLPVSQAADLLRVDQSKLIEWNNLESVSSLLKEGHVLRVFDPKHFTPNYRFLIPEEAVGQELIVYTVLPGDTLESIAKKFHVIEELITDINHLDGRVTVGQDIVIYKN